MTTLGLKNVNMLSKEQYNGIAEPATDELYAISGSGFGLPSDRFIDLELGASGTSYTAPANGWYNVVETTSSANSGFISAIIYRNGVKLYEFRISSPNSSNSQGGIYPVFKNDIMVLTYDRMTMPIFRFIFSEGEE